MMENYFNNFIQQYLDINVDTETLIEIKKHLSIIRGEKNQILLKENQRHNFAYFVLKGAVRGYYMRDGIEVNTWFAFENEMVGSLHNYKNLPSRETIEIVEPSTLISINLLTLKPLTTINLRVSNFVGSIIEEYALFLEDRIFYSQFTNSKERYMHLVENEPHVLQRIPLTYIASYLGISRETLSRLRGK